MNNFTKEYLKVINEDVSSTDEFSMTLHDLIVVLQKLENELGGNTEVKIEEIEEGYNESDRYGVGMGLKVGDNFVEQKKLSNYTETGCIY